MAAAAPSPLASSVEKTNGAKLSRLLIDGGTKVLKKHFDNYHPPQNLEVDFMHHYDTLNCLLEAGHLHSVQWKKLFPRNKAGNKVKPDSKNFDITLLFLLLTNICDLSPPNKEWHRMPRHDDNSFEANLARIKFYRNDLHGHVTTTGLDTPTFRSMWGKISNVLVALGLNQAEVDRLKAERCGEENYIAMLLEWADSEKDIKSQLKDMRQHLDGVRKTQLEDLEILQKSKVRLEEVHQRQIKTQQTVDEVRKTQLEDHKTLEESKMKLEEGHRGQIKIQQTVDKVRRSQLEDHKTLEECKVKLEEGRQVQTRTQQAVGQVRNTQLEDRELLHDSKVKLEGVHQVQASTQQAVGEVRQTQLEDHWKLEEVLQIEKTTHDVVTESRQSQLKDSKAIQDTKSKAEEVSERLERLELRFEPKAEDLEGKRENNRQDEILKKLAKINTMRDIRRHTDSYVDGTRLSIFATVESWLDDRSSPNRVMMICGNPGMGKSVISAVTCKKMREAGRLAGSHFCQHDKARHRNPKVMLQSLASHLADSLPDYKKALEEKLSRNLGVGINDMELNDLFELLFEEPLSSLNDPDVTYLMVIDGIDESEYQGRNELLDVIAEYFNKLPLWIRFLVTTRPEVNIAERLKCLHPLQLEPNNEENLKDIHLFFKGHLNNVLLSEYQEIVLQSLVQKSEGVMLYAYYLVDFIKENVPVLTPELLGSTLPSGISSVYHSYFKRLETELRKELNVTEEQFMNFLSAVAAVREPMPLGFLSKLLVSRTSPSTVQRKVKAAITCVSALLPVEDERIHFFHKSVKDWLIEKSTYGQHHFSVDVKEGHLLLSKLCIEKLDDLKRKSIDSAHFTHETKYALQHAVQHMLQLGEDARVCSLEDVVKKYCLDLEIVYAKLCVSDTVASEDILSIQKPKCAEASIEEWQKTLGALLYLLRKHWSTLAERPHAIFQTLLNEGVLELSSEALHLLETRCCQIPYMEFVHKKDLGALVQTKFQCFAKVVCFDVSPQLDYMVCECQDYTIQLWSLHTGKQLWKRPAEVLKNYYWLVDGTFFVYKLFRTGPSSGVKSFYRSVVFHPTENLVLPGILSHAYTFYGDLKPLFLSSKCRFTVCSIAADKTKVLTNCPDSAKLITMWSLTDGSEITHFDCNEDILSFAWSRDGRLLALSHPDGLIRLVDVVDGFKTLTKTTTLKECGMIKFSPDCQFLFCVHSEMGRGDSFDLFCFHVKNENDSILSLQLFPDKVCYYPWEFESCSETGFLLGDPFFCSPFKEGSFYLREKLGLSFVMKGQSALWVSFSSSVIEMLNLDELRKQRDGYSKTAVQEVAFSLDGDTLYVVTEKDATIATLMAWDISSEKWKTEKGVGFRYFCPVNDSSLVAVRGGVLLKTRSGSLELWNDELSECIRSWTCIDEFCRVIPISEERVVCGNVLRGSSKVIILDTASGDIVSTININGHFVTCNSKFQVSLKEERYNKLQMQCGEDVLWKISLPFHVMPFLRCNTFSPTGEYCVVGGEPEDDYQDISAIHVLDVASGKILHRLCTSNRWFPSIPDCKFMSDEECVISIGDAFEGYCLKLFNVKSGEILSEVTIEYKVCSLAACPRTGLIAIGLGDSKDGFKVLKVKLPRDKDSKKNKSIELQD